MMCINSCFEFSDYTAQNTPSWHGAYYRKLNCLLIDTNTKQLAYVKKPGVIIYMDKPNIEFYIEEYKFDTQFDYHPLPKYAKFIKMENNIWYFNNKTQFTTEELINCNP